MIGQNRVSILQQGQWTHCDPPEGVQEFHDVSAGFLQQTGNLVVYAVAPFSSRNSQTSGGVVVSSDGGRTWKQANEGFLSLAEPDSKRRRVWTKARTLQHKFPTSRIANPISRKAANFLNRGDYFGLELVFDW